MSSIFRNLCFVFLFLYFCLILSYLIASYLIWSCLCLVSFVLLNLVLVLSWYAGMSWSFFHFFVLFVCLLSMHICHLSVVSTVIHLQFSCDGPCHAVFWVILNFLCLVFAISLYCRSQHRALYCRGLDLGSCHLVSTCCVSSSWSLSLHDPDYFGQSW